MSSVDLTAYHDSVGLDRQTRYEYAKHCSRQDRYVLYWFLRHGSGTPSMVHEHLPLRAPLTSIRRAITNLTNRGWLVKTDATLPGPYGHAEHIWQLAPDRRQLPLC